MGLTLILTSGIGDCRYNPNNVGILEQCIQAMIDENEYDKDIVLTTLKLYQLNPDR